MQLSDNELQVEEIEDERSSGATVVFVSIEGIYAGWIAIRDPVRPGVPELVAYLHAHGHSVHMCTGDAEVTAVAVANSVGIRNVRAGMLPSEKVDYVKKLQKESGSIILGRKQVVMIGDGLNDGPALSQANVGIAVGCGATITVNAADVVFVRSDLRKALVTFFELMRACRSVIMQNLFWAFVFNFCMLPLAAGLFYPRYKLQLPPLLAGCMMALSSTMVLISSLRLVGFRSSLDDDLSDPRAIEMRPSKRRNPLE